MLSFKLVRGGPVATRASSTLVSRNVTVAGHRTSMRLEPAMWDALEEVCRREQASLGEIATVVGHARSASSLTAAMRVFVLNYFYSAATEDGHRRAGHGAAHGHRDVVSRPSAELPSAVADAPHAPV